MADIIHKIFGQKHGHHSKKGDHDSSSKKDDSEGYTKQQIEFCK